MTSMTSPPTGARQTMQVVRFYVGGQQYAIDIMQVKEIIIPVPVVPMPSAPDFIEGIIELRGTFLPTVDVRKRFGLNQTALTRESKFVVANLAGVYAALIVDSVLDVRRIALADIEDAPSLTRSADAGFVLGVAKWDNEIAMLLDLHRILSDTERDALQRAG